MMSNHTRTRRSLLSVAPLAVAVAGLGLAAGTAQATPSGLSNYPSTDIYTNGGFHFDSDYFSGLNNGGRVTTGSSIGLEYGLGRNADGIGGRNEIGFDFLTFPNDEADGFERILLNGKTQLFNSDASATRIVRASTAWEAAGSAPATGFIFWIEGVRQHRPLPPGRGAVAGLAQRDPRKPHRAAAGLRPGDQRQVHLRG
jgi:hypothetical protein